MITKLSILICALLPIFSIAQTQQFKGINLDQSFETKSKWTHSPSNEEISLIQSLGFNSVRIPFLSTTLLRPNNSTSSPAYSKRLLEVVNSFLDKGFFVVLDLHDKQLADNKDQLTIDSLAATWSEVAYLFKGAGDNLYFEVLNEPIGFHSTQEWQLTQAKALESIRRITPKRKIVLTGAGWGDVDSLLALEPKIPIPSNDLFTFHFYDPMWLTHQGAQWVANGSYPIGRNWSRRDSSSMRITKKLDAASDWMHRNNANVFIGEFGVIDRANSASRFEWINFIRTEAERRKLGWFLWSFKGDFGVYDAANDCVQPSLVLALFDVLRKLPQGNVYCNE